MIGWLIQEQHIGLLHQGLGDRQTLAPAAGKAGCICGEVFKARPPKRFSDTPFPLRRRSGDTLERCFENSAHGGSGHELGLLRNIAQPRALARRNLAAVGVDLPGEDAQQRRLTRAIRSDQTDAGALFDREVDVAQQRLGPE